MGIYYRSSADLLLGRGEPNGHIRNVFPTPHKLPLFSAEIVREVENSFLHYIFIEKRDKHYPRVKYHCTRCGNAIPGERQQYIWTNERTIDPNIMELVSAPHNGYSHCPVCRCVGQVKEVWRIQKSENYAEWRSFLVFQQSSPNEVFIRFINARRERNSGLICGTTFSEWQYIRLTPRLCNFFSHGYGGWSSYTNENVRKGGVPNSRVLGMDSLQGSFLQYSVTPEYVKSFENNVALASCFAAMYPCTEMLYKMGFKGIITDWICDRKKNAYCLNIEAEGIAELFRIPKSTVDYLMREIKADKRVSNDISYVFRGIKLFGKDIEGCKLAIEFCDKYSFWWSQPDIRKVYTLIYGEGRYERERLLKIIRYVERYREKRSYERFVDFASSIRLYYDYLHEGEYLKLDFSEEVVLFPKDLTAAHDNAAKLATLVREQEKTKALSELYERYTERYGFEKYGYKVIAPKSTKDIIKEGKYMHHCVGGYADRHAGGKLAILFIRKVTDLSTPYVTVEVQGSEVKQVQGMRNQPTWEKEPDRGESFNQFLSEWKKFIKKNKKPLCAVV